MLTLFRKKEVFMEQREHPRFALYQKTFFSSETDHLVNCEVYDISHSGLGFHTNISIENGTIVNILIYHKNSIIKLKAMIIRSKYNQIYKYGAQIISNPSQVSRIIKDIST